MAQLSDDCFAFGGPLLAIDEVERLIVERIAPIGGVDSVALRQASGRVLAADLLAPVDLPPFANSAVDGYAVRHADLRADAPTRLRVIDRLGAGKPASLRLETATAVRIFTGAPMPVGADTVFMQEDCRVEGSLVIVPPGLRLGANRRLAGEDVKAGTQALPAGQRLAPQHLALAAALGCRVLDVRARVRVGLFSTGDEIVEPGSPLRPASLYDANRHLLAEMLDRLGAQVTDYGILNDDESRLTAGIKQAAAENDLVLTSGGVSTGEADLVRDVVGRIGRLVFWRVAIKPGRPVMMGVVPGSDPGSNTAFVGLPGNPVAVFVTFARVVRPLLLRLSGARAEPLVALPVRSNFAYRKKKGRREYVRVALRRAADGMLEADKYPQDGAGVVTSLTRTDGLAELPEEAIDIAVGATIGFLPYAALIG